MLRRSSVLVLAIVTTLGLASCVSPPAPAPAGSQTAAASTEASPPATTAESGATVAGDGYSFAPPEGWQTVAGAEVPDGIDVAVVDSATSDGFSDNMNVLLSPAGELTPEQAESGGVDELEGVGATDVTVLDRVDVAGSTSAHLSAAFSSGGTEYQIEQFYPTNDGQTYVVTFSFSLAASEAERTALVTSVLDTWVWA